MEEMYNFIKRFFDVFLVIITGWISLPLIAFIAILVKFIDGGDVFFRQERAGKDGIPFVLYKFRTMKSDSDPYGNSPRTGDDPRLTRVGKWLRIMSLDELPQLLNVLRGDMTLVGPRPLYVSQMAEWNSRQTRRLEVKPGLTGLAQISGRGELAIEEKLELDVKYVENKSLLFDLRILFATVFKVLIPNGIYEKKYSQTQDVRGKG